MKIDRLIGILSVLLQEEKITAPELADKFEVSRRTINRDIEDLCKAGIPITTTQGSGGGIRIMDGYRMNRTLLTSKDMQMILAGLRSLDSVSGRDSILIDLSSWYKETLAPKIELIQNAVEERNLLTFQYYAPKGNGKRSIEPYYLVYKWSSWYVWGWCTGKKDYRLFKLNRMDALLKEDTTFMPREVPMPNLSDEKIFPGGIKVKALFTRDSQWRLVEEFGIHCFIENEDGTLLFTADYTEKENLLSWLLTFGDKVKVLEPAWVQEELIRIAKNIIKAYDAGN